MTERMDERRTTGAPIIGRFLDPTSGHIAVKIGPGEHYVSANGNEIIMTALGSCVAACIRDPIAGVGGVNHFMLPHSDAGAWDTEVASLRYGNFAMPRLIDDILQRGGQIGRLEIKLFGGARLGSDGGEIGRRNVSFVERYLQDASLPWVVAELGGTIARRLIYMPLNGRAFVLGLPAQTLLRNGEEAARGTGQRMPPALRGNSQSAKKGKP